MIKYNFTEEETKSKALSNRDYSDLIVTKWGLNSLVFRTFSFTEPIPTAFDAHDFFLQLFKMKDVAIKEVTSVEYSQLTTNITGKSFFTKLWTSEPRIARNSPGHPISQCPDVHFHDMWLSTTLQNAILNEDSEWYDTFTEADRNELIYYVMKALVIGGMYCQFEDNWDVYEPIIISLYRDLVGQSVVKNPSGAISIVSRAYVITKTNGKDVCGYNDRAFYLVIIDSIGKKVRLLSNECSV